MQAKALEIIANYYYDNEQYPEALKILNGCFTCIYRTGDSLKKANIYNLYGLANFNTGYL